MQFTKFKLLWIFFLIFFNPTYSFSNSVQSDNGKKYFISGEVNSKKSLDVKNQNLKRNNTLVNVKTGNDLNLLVDEIIKGINKPESLTKFKELKKLVSAVFNSNPIFLQTLESMKLSKAKKDEVFAAFLPQVRSSAY